MNRARNLLLVLALLPICAGQPASAYSLLTHEQLIDLTWDDSIVPLLKSQYPNLTSQQLDRARSYAYGGCVIQDIGYYPSGDQFFSDLTHYVRTGDFVMALFRNAHNANELAFAIGALSHYVGDSFGHSEATNRAVAMEFPKLAARYGPSVNYAEGRHQHVQAEFAFDIDQIAHHRMAPLRYSRRIGIRVPMRQLTLAFYQTYGIRDGFDWRGRQIINRRAYHFATRTFIPRIAYALTLLHRNDEPPEPDTPDAKLIEAEAAQVDRINNWPAHRRKAGVETHLLAGVIWILPKVGPLKMLAVKGPTPQAEADYMHSVVTSTTVLRKTLILFTPIAARAKQTWITTGSTATESATLAPLDRSHPLPNRDLDTGQKVKPGGYVLTDTTYAKLLEQLTRKPTQSIPPGIKRDVAAYYADPDAPIATKKNSGAWKKVQDELQVLAAMPTSTEPEPYPTYGEDNPAGD